MAIIVTVVGIVIGSLAGFYGGWLDAVVSRIGDIFFAIPTVLGAIVLMSILPTHEYHNSQAQCQAFSSQSLRLALKVALNSILKKMFGSWKCFLD